MKVFYYFRHNSIGFSIEHVANVIIDALSDRVEAERVEMPERRSLPWHILKNIRYASKHKEKGTLCHITGHCYEVVLGLRGCKKIITFHDIGFIENNPSRITRMYKYMLQFYLPVKRSDAIICISNSTRDKIAERMPSCAKRLVVIPNPVDPVYKFSPAVFNEKKPRILHIGTGTNKNLHRVIMALEGIDCHLRIIGKLSGDHRALLNQYKVEYSNGYRLTDDEIFEEYVKCDIVSFPSEYEGFGMPVIEGQRVGRVVLTSDISPMNVISGGYAHLVDNQSVRSIKEGFIKLIKNRAYRETLIEGGLKNVENYSVDCVAEQYYDLYNKVLSKK